MEDKNRLAKLIASSLVGLESESERKELSAWLELHADNRKLYEQLKNSLMSEGKLAELAIYDPTKDWGKVKAKMRGLRKKVLYRRFAMVGSVAALAVMVTMASIFTGGKNDMITIEVTDNDAVLKDNHRAVLILPDGESLSLGNENQIPVEYNLHDNGAILEYNTASIVTPEVPVYHTLKVPRGSEYEVLLSDGTRVYLNADSEIRYPERFLEEQRVVELSGEAYFDVAHDPHKPFVVRNGTMRLTVLGTEFNFRAYEGESRQATLINGRIGVSLSNNYLEMDPGFQACEVEEGLFLREVRTEDYIGWKNKRFIYNGATLEDAMIDIARWYDLKVEFTDRQTAELKFTANIPRYEDVNEILDIIEQAVYAKIEVSGKTVTFSNEK